MSGPASRPRPRPARRAPRPTSRSRSTAPTLGDRLAGRGPSRLARRPTGGRVRAPSRRCRPSRTGSTRPYIDLRTAALERRAHPLDARRAAPVAAPLPDGRRRAARRSPRATSTGLGAVTRGDRRPASSWPRSPSCLDRRPRARRARCSTAARPARRRQVRAADPRAAGRRASCSTSPPASASSARSSSAGPSARRIARSSTRTVIALGDGAAATVVEELVATGCGRRRPARALLAGTTEVSLGAGAQARRSRASRSWARHASPSSIAARRIGEGADAALGARPARRPPRPQPRRQPPRAATGAPSSRSRSCSAATTSCST